MRKAELDCSQGGKTTAAEKRLEEMKAQIAAKRDVVSLWCQDVPSIVFIFFGGALTAPNKRIE